MKFSRNLFPELAVPEKVFFVDCKVLGLEEFSISWGWPLVYEQDVPEETKKTEAATNTGPEVVDKSLLHAVIEYKEGQEVKRVKALTSPFIFKGMLCQQYYSSLQGL